MRLLNKLVMKGATFPPRLIVRGISQVGANPVAGGGFADVWKGKLKGKDVALKVLRIFGSPEERAVTYKVGDILVIRLKTWILYYF